MTAPNPFWALREQLEQASTASAVVSALACLRRVSAVLEAAGVRVGDGGVPFGRDCVASISMPMSVAALVVPVLRVQGVLAGFAADPETGELPGGEESDRAELLGGVAEMVLRVGDGAGDGELREWAAVCSSLLLDICQHVDTVDGIDFDADPAGVPGPVTDGELRTQAQVLAVLAEGAADAMRRVSELTEEAHAGLLAAVAPVLEAG